ncbi:MAG: citramalate synthase [Patescibacteria group bacterium]|nr:citramalate synthase [Patescibacteria group bacterium]
MSKKIEIFDTTLRDGTQAEDFNLSVEDKIRITLKLDELGVDYIEGGWPGSNQKDEEYFREIQNYQLNHSKIVAFGSTHHAGQQAHKDPNLKALVKAKTPVIIIFGKTWDFHVKDVLRISLERNLELIRDSLLWLKESKKTLFYDAEHFFDGYKANPEYAIKTLQSALDGGAECLILCDTNGGTMPWEITKIVKEVREKISNEVKLGIHCHNDSESAVINSLTAVKAGITQVQGTINGFGERCGNANLCSVIPNLVLKMGYDCKAGKNLDELTGLSRFVSEIANLAPSRHQPYVGQSAFAHKGGIHASAVQRNPKSYEHIEPELVGNIQRILISELAGKSNVLAKAKEFGVDLKSSDPVALDIVNQLKRLEAEGFQFENAEASFELLMREATTGIRHFFETLDFSIISQRRKKDDCSKSEAVIKIGVGGNVEHTAAEGEGPVNALDNAFKKALLKFYPQIEKMSLKEFKVRNLSSDGTKSQVRVLIRFYDGHKYWGTVGVSHDLIEASWQALVDAYRYGLMIDANGKTE